MEPVHDNSKLIHKIKNSINNIQTSLEIIKDDIPPESDSRETLKITYEEIEKLYNYIKQIESHIES